MAAPNVPNVPIAPLVPQLQAQPPQAQPPQAQPPQAQPAQAQPAQAQPAQAQPAPIVLTTTNIFDVFSSKDMYALYGRQVGDNPSKITHPSLSQTTPQATKDIYVRANILIAEIKKKMQIFNKADMKIVTHTGYGNIQNELKKTGLVINFLINSTPFPNHADEIGFHITFHGPRLNPQTQQYENTPGQMHVKFNEGVPRFIPILLNVIYDPTTPIGSANMVLKLDFINTGDIITYCTEYIKDPNVESRLNTHWTALQSKLGYTNTFDDFKTEMVQYYHRCFRGAMFVIEKAFLRAFQNTILRPTSDIESALGITGAQGAQGAPIPRTLSVFDPVIDPKTGLQTEYKKSGMHKYLKYKTKYLELKKMLDDLNIND